MNSSRLAAWCPSQDANGIIAMVQCMASAPSTALLDWTTRAHRRATRTRSHARWEWRSNANLALAAQQALAHIVVATISAVLARLALRLTRWGWGRTANLARAPC